MHTVKSHPHGHTMAIGKLDVCRNSSSIGWSLMSYCVLNPIKQIMRLKFCFLILGLLLLGCNIVQSWSPFIYGDEFN